MNKKDKQRGFILLEERQRLLVYLGYLKSGKNHPPVSETELLLIELKIYFVELALKCLPFPSLGTEGEKRNG